jgi:hypothetical protein
MLVTKGSTPFIIDSFWTKKLELNLGVVLTIIFPFIDRETIEITSPLIPFKRKVVLSKFQVVIVENELAYSIWASRRVLLLERAMDLVLYVLYRLVLYILELLGGFLVLWVLLLLVSILGLFPPWFLVLVWDTIDQSFYRWDCSS